MASPQGVAYIHLLPKPAAHGIKSTRMAAEGDERDV